MYKLFRILLLAILVSVTLYVINADASSETNQIPIRGEGAGRISGFKVSDIHYRLAEDSLYISGVEFDLDGPANQVIIGFDTASDQSFTCINTGQLHWFCEVNNVMVSLIYKLRVIAVG